ncbi:MAG: hypothetical protein RIC14_00485 [Filomicrobium sp.]
MIEIAIHQFLNNEEKRDGALQLLLELSAEQLMEEIRKHLKSYHKFPREGETSLWDGLFLEYIKRFSSLSRRDEYEDLIDALLQERICGIDFLKSASDHFWAAGPVEHSKKPTIAFLERGNDLFMLFRAGDLCNASDEFEARHMYFKAASDWDAKSGQEHCYVGHAALRLKRWDQAVQAYQQALEADSTNFEAWASIAACAIAAQRIELFQSQVSLFSPGERGLSNIFANLPPADSVNFFHLADLGGFSDLARQAKLGMLARISGEEDERVACQMIATASSYGQGGLCDEILYTLHPSLHEKKGGKDKTAAFKAQLIKSLLTPLRDVSEPDNEVFINDLIESWRALASDAVELEDPVVDLHPWTSPWQAVFCRGVPHLARPAMSALNDLSLAVWPSLGFTAPFISKGLAKTDDQRISVGFMMPDTIPMVSGLMERLDSSRFACAYLHPTVPGLPPSRTRTEWIERAERVVEVPIDHAGNAQKILAAQELDILISGCAGYSLMFPMIGRVAKLQMILIEPNWCDGFPTHDYYISWKPAEPTNHEKFYNSAVAFLDDPPYWIEEPLEDGEKLARVELERQLGLPSDKRLYLCPTTLAKLHPKGDELFAKILEKDKDGVLVFLRVDLPIGPTVRARIQSALGGELSSRALFLPSQPRHVAHSILGAADCVIDGYPLGGMSSSFAAALLGTPTVSLAEDIPFGKWMGAVLEYLDVEGLTARSAQEFAEIAFQLANDRAWREEKRKEILSKRSKLIANHRSLRTFEEFLCSAYERDKAGLDNADWISGDWVERRKS